MSEMMTNQYVPDTVSPPGETLSEILQERGMKQTEFADRTGRTPKFVNEVIKGKAPITPRVALEFQRVLGIPSSFWNNRQRQYDAFLAVKREAAVHDSNLSWAKNFPYAEMAKRNWVPKTRDKLQKLTNILDFFGVASPSAWDKVWGNLKVPYRKSATLAADEFALAAWLQKGELVARTVSCQPFDEGRFREALAGARKLTTTGPDVFVPELVRICAASGVAVAFVPELPRTASGATRWLHQNTALLQLSLKYKTNDHLWFTFFHEAAHILLHQKKAIFLEQSGCSSDQESEADRFAADFLIPRRAYDSYLSSRPAGNFSERSVRHFASEQNVHPGIVVGRLQHEGLLRHSHLRELKMPLKWATP